MENRRLETKEWLEGKELLITGGTGTLGKALLKELINYRLKGLRILSRDEFKQWTMKTELAEEIQTAPFPIAFFIGDVRDRDRLTQAFKGVNIVIHTAAMKQIESCEYNPLEATLTNVKGTENVCKEAIACDVAQVMFISTDKAVYPINFYGTTKALAEKTVIKANVYSPHQTQFNVCRYGNVLGSRGSVIQVFQDQLKANKPMTITERSMTRFWISSSFMARFILNNLSLDTRGVIFVPQMKAASILDIAGYVHSVSPVHNHKVDKEICLKEIGIRKGEKIHECLISNEELENTRLGEFSYMILNKDFHNEELKKTSAPIIGLVGGYTSENAPELTKNELEEMINE